MFDDGVSEIRTLEYNLANQSGEFLKKTISLSLMQLMTSFVLFVLKMILLISGAFKYSEAQKKAIEGMGYSIVDMPQEKDPLQLMHLLLML